MKSIDKNLSDIFDIDPITPTNVIEVKETTVVEIKDSTIEDDVEFARQNIKKLINKGGVAFDSLLLVANESEQPRAYEVVATLIKNLSDLNKDLLELQKRKKDLQGSDDKKQSGNVNVDKAVFVGSTTELVKFLKNNK
jgi:hypothetical protein